MGGRGAAHRSFLLWRRRAEKRRASLRCESPAAVRCTTSMPLLQYYLHALARFVFGERLFDGTRYVSTSGRHVAHHRRRSSHDGHVSRHLGAGDRFRAA